MKKTLRIIAGFYLGFALSIFGGIDCFDWRFYVIVCPFFLLWIISDEDDSE
jgi:hypothetical protein